MDTIEAIARTIVAALAVGVLESALLAGFVFVLVHLRPRPSATTRHVLWSVALAASALLPIVSVAGSLGHVERVRSPAIAIATNGAAVAQNVVATGANSVPAVLSVTNAPAGGPLPSAASFFSSLAARAGALPMVGTSFAAIWLLGVLAGLLSIVRAFVSLRAIKLDAAPLEESVTRRLRRWRHSSRFGRTTGIRASNAVDVPIAVGFRSPSILLPIRMENEAITDLDQIAMHEYAHLDRYDDWSNLLQRIVERVFWFNPIAAFIGRRIALEREIACDDWVISQTGHAHRYASCLWRLAESTRLPAQPVLAPGALLTPRQITVRIEQLLDVRRNALPRLSPAGVLAVAAVSLAAIVFQAQHAPALALPAEPEAPRQVAHAKPAVVTERRFILIERHGDKAPTAAALAETLRRFRAQAHALKFVSATSARVARFRPRPQRMHPRFVPNDPRRLPTVIKLMKRAPDGAMRETTMLVVASNAAWPSKTDTASEADLAAETAGVRSEDESADPIQLPALSRVGPTTVTISNGRHFSFKGVSPATLPMDAQNVLLRSVIREAQAYALVAQRRAEAALPPVEPAKPQSAPVTRATVERCYGCNLSGADLHNVDLSGLTLINVDLSAANLRGANLRGVRLVGVNLRRAKLDDADLRSSSIEKSLLAGVSLIGARLDDAKITGSDARQIRSTPAVLRALLAACSACNLEFADLHGVDLHGLHLIADNLRGANLRAVHLSDAALDRVDLRNARVDGADFADAVLRDCIVNGVNFSVSNISGTLIDEVDALTALQQSHPPSHPFPEVRIQ